MNGKLLKLRHKLGLVFDDDLGTRQWYNIADWVIVGMIALSSLEIFLATMPVGQRFMHVLDIINEVTLWFFVIEVSLRIWAAPEQSPRYSGLMGRVRYCFTFYGFIDFVSTYPFLVQYFYPLPIGAMKILRTARIIRVFRITRYAHSFNLLSGTIREKRRELLVSMQFLVIITFILSIMLYVYEHEAQPEVYDHGLRSVIWSFAQYIGDPGQFADTPPVTLPGRIIACIVGVLGIAIVAVPAGILGAGFTEAIESEGRLKSLEENRRKVRNAFERKLDRPTGYQIVLPYRTLPELQARMGLKQDDIIDACEGDPSLRLINLAATIPVKYNPIDRLAVEHVYINNAYGCLIDRGSAITIVSPSGIIDPCTSVYAYYLAKIGGFNLISREIGERAPYKSYYILPDDSASDPALSEFLHDARRLLSRPGAWGVTFNISSGALEPEYDTHVHVGLGGPKGDTQLSVHDLVHDMDTFRTFYTRLEQVLADEFDLRADAQKYHSTANPRLYLRHLGLPAEANNMVLRMEWNKVLWDPRRMLLAHALASVLSETLAGRPLPCDSTLYEKNIGYDGY